MKDFAKSIHVGNKEVGNADPRIAALKSKIKMLKDQKDTGALKDVLKLADDIIKDLKTRKEKLSSEIYEIDKDLDGWISLKSDVKFSI